MYCNKVACDEAKLLRGSLVGNVRPVQDECWRRVSSYWKTKTLFVGRLGVLAFFGPIPFPIKPFSENNIWPKQNEILTEQQ